MKRNAVILGAGVGGLAAGWMLARTGQYQVTVVERAAVVGGVCGTFRHGDFLLDYGPHKSYSTIPGVLDELLALMGDEFLQHRKSNTIYLFGHYLKYPVSIVDLATKMGAKNLIRAGLDTVGVLMTGAKSRPAESYEQYVVNRFGQTLYQLVFAPLADKVWGDPATLSADIARTRIPSTSVLDTALRAMGLKKENRLTDAQYFYYPRQGFGRIPGRMAEEIAKAGGAILTNTTPAMILRDGTKVTGVAVERSGQTENLSCDLLVSSLPLDAVARLLGVGQDRELHAALADAEKLQYRNAFLVYVFLRKEVLTRHHWLFFPERDLIFGRVFEQKLLSAEMAPRERTVLCCDFTDYVDGPLSGSSDAALAERCIRDLEKVGLIEAGWVEETLVKRLPKFYPRYDLAYKTTIANLYDGLKRYDNLLSTGRVGFYNYNNSDHCIDMGRFIAESLAAGKSSAEIWSLLEERVANYRIVD
jgi:protoporphyrinogen oxidase